MEHLTLEEIIDTANTFGAMAVVGAGVVATAFLGLKAIGKISRRCDYVKHYKDPYYEDRLKVKPNIFNIRRIMNPEYKDKYWVRKEQNNSREQEYMMPN